jgi:hypothetical protein
MNEEAGFPDEVVVVLIERERPDADFTLHSTQPLHRNRLNKIIPLMQSRIFTPNPQMRFFS